MSARAVTIEIPPRNDYLALVRRTVATTARLQGGVTDRRVDDLSLAVSEACTNAINAARARDRSEPIVVAVLLNDHDVTVTVTDRAGGFVVEDVDPSPAADDPGRLRHERGLGLPLIRSLADEVVFTPVDDGTEVRIRVNAA
jgi:serine/threonine-protein kinase RsbW